MLTKTTWYRPASAAGFVPATPGAELARNIQSVVTANTARQDLSAKIVEHRDKSLKQHLV